MLRAQLTRRGLLLLLLICLGIGWPRTAAAHAMLDRSEPPADAQLRTVPDRLTLYFTQGLKASGSWILLRDSSGQDIDFGTEFDSRDNRVMYSMLPSTLTPDVYTVRWQSLSANDDDYATGSFKITILNPDGSRPGTASDSRSGGGSGFDAKWVIGLGLLVALGGVGMGVVVWRRTL